MTMNIPRIDRFTLLLAAIGMLGTALVLLRESAHGVGLRLDSSIYISTARSLAAGEGFNSYWGIYENAAPLFPLVLASAATLGVDAITAAGYVNIIAFGLTILMTAMWLRSRIQSRFLVAWAGCACALSLPLAWVSAQVLTEPLFILCVTLSLFALDRFLDNRKWSFLFLTAMCAALACLTRYIGITVVASALPLILLQRDTALPAKARYASFYSIVALTPLGLWMLRNFLNSGTLTGGVGATGFSPLSSLNIAVSELSRWLIGPTGVEFLDRASIRIFNTYIFGGSAVAVVLLKIALLLIIVATAGYTLTWINRRRAVSVKWRMWAVPTVFVSIYALALAAALPLTDVDLPHRYLAPIYPPALVAGTLALNEFFRYTSGAWPLGMLPFPEKWTAGLAEKMTASVGTLILTVGLSLWLLPHVSANYYDIKHWMSNDKHSYSTKEWAKSQTVGYVKSASLAGRFWTNDGPALYLLADIRDKHRSLTGNPERRAVSAHADGANAYFVWFHHPRYSSGGGYGIAELAALPGMELVAELRDGVILKSAPDSADSAETLEEGGILKVILKDAHLIIRADFDVYLDNDRLIYVRNGCSDSNVGPRFFVHIDPGDNSDLPRHRKRHGFDNLDFEYKHGFARGGMCIAVRSLPNYTIAQIRTGQYTSEGRVWEAVFSFNDAEPTETIDKQIKNAQLIIQSDFDVYLDDNRLIYVKERCTDTDTEPRFFLHVDPVGRADLPERRKQYGFDNLDFRFDKHGSRHGGQCVAMLGLPDYPIASIRTGQYTSEGQIWKGTFDFAAK